MNTLANSLRKANITPGDIVEMAHFTDTLDQTLNNASGDPTPIMAGQLIEITAIGETAILGYWLEGEANDPTKKAQTYSTCTWRRNGNESKISGYRVFRKIGYLKNNQYTWLYPDLNNIYTRCQQ